MNTEIAPLELKWINFIRNFSPEMLEITQSTEKKSTLIFKIPSLLNSGIRVSNDYGFLCLKFDDIDEKSKFLSHTSVVCDIDKNGVFVYKSTNWLSAEFPCRVYISDNNKVVSFYDYNNLESDEDAFRKRISTLRSTLYALINLKLATVATNTEI